MAARRKENRGCGDSSQEQAQGKSLPSVWHQLIPTAVQCVTNSGHGGNEQVYFPRLNSPNATRVYVGKFGQSLLGHPQGRTNTANVAAEFSQTGDHLSFGHTILRETFDIDLKGVIRPVLKM